MSHPVRLTFLIVLAAAAITWSCQQPIVEGQNAGDCSDRADNDLDGLFDCDDETCRGSPVCEGDGDDDTSPVGDDDTAPVGDDDTSGAPGDDDTGGSPYGDDDTGGGGTGGAGESGINCSPSFCPNCEDGVDNDSDGAIDCDDSDCSKWCGQGSGPPGGGDDDSEGGGDEVGEGYGPDCTETSCPECSDGYDNDEDGDTDCEDPGCIDFCGGDDDTNPGGM
jgi:hypothetical protein